MTQSLDITLVNEDDRVVFSHWTEPLDDDLSSGEIYRRVQREYGRCTSRVYRERRIKTNDRGGERWETEAIGWCFIKRDETEDTHEPYLRGAWVTVITNHNEE